MEEFKKELFDAYERHCINVMNEDGNVTIEEFIDSFINIVDFDLRYTSGILEDMEEIFHTSDIEEIEKQIEDMIKDYEYKN